MLEMKNDWSEHLSDCLKSEEYKKLNLFLEEEYKTQTVYPEIHRVFEGLDLTSYEETKVVILGQDPYHGPNQAHGLSFSVLPGNKVPPSLVNIYKELESDLGYPPVTHGYLESWAKQGVLMLNTVLTVRQGEPNSHKGQGWEIITDRIIETLNEKETPVIFVLWGKPAQQKIKMIDQSKHKIIAAPHPSPLAAYRGFFGSKPFSTINAYLKESHQEIINWKLSETV